MTAPDDGLRAALEAIRDYGYQPMYNGRPSCPFCQNFVDDEEGHRDDCVLVAALAATNRDAEPPALDALRDRFVQRVIRDLTGFLISTLAAPDYEHARALAEGFVAGQPDLLTEYARLATPPTPASAEEEPE